jgi:hypothetical protein
MLKMADNLLKDVRAGSWSLDLRVAFSRLLYSYWLLAGPLTY